MAETFYLPAAIAVIAAVTFAVRAVPFFLFGGRKRLPRQVEYLGHVLPPAMIAILVVYCFKAVTPLSGNHGIPELICGLLVVLLHIWKRNTFLSIAVGTVCYMLLVQTVF